jgi:hypothetical protein
VPAVTVQERYPLMVLPLDGVAEASALARRAGYGRIIPAREA